LSKYPQMPSSIEWQQAKQNELLNIQTDISNVYSAVPLGLCPPSLNGGIPTQEQWTDMFAPAMDSLLTLPPLLASLAEVQSALYQMEHSVCRRQLAIAKAVEQRAREDLNLTRTYLSRTGPVNTSLKYFMKSEYWGLIIAAGNLFRWLKTPERMKDLEAAEQSMNPDSMKLYLMIRTHVMHEDISLANSQQADGFEADTVGWCGFH